MSNKLATGESADKSAAWGAHGPSRLPFRTSKNENQGGKNVPYYMQLPAPGSL